MRDARNGTRDEVRAMPSPMTGGSDRIGGAQRGSRIEEASFGGWPIDAWIGYRDAVLELGAIRAERLISRFDIALEHHAHDRIAAGADLIDQGLQHRGLLRIVLAGLRVRTIHHHARFQSCAREHLAAFANTARVVVRFAAPAEHDVSVRISRGPDYR